MAGIKAKKLTAVQVRKELRGRTKEELSALLEGLYKSCPDAANYLNIRFAGGDFEKAFLAEAKEKIRGCFFTKKGKARLDLPAAKSVIDDFEKACPDPGSILDLKLHYIENGMEIIERYNGIPDRLYSSVERMFHSVARDMNAIEDPAKGLLLAVRFEDRLAEIGRDTGWGDDGFHKCMNECYREIRWRHAADCMEAEACEGMEAEKSSDLSDPSVKGTAAVLPEPASITDSSNVLPAEDADLFYRIFFPLLDFVNEKLQINDLKDLGAQKELDASAVKDIANKVWEDVSLIDEYLTTQGASLPQDHQAILKSWKRCVNGRFVLERNLKNGAILISLDDSSVYQVRGIKSSFEEMYYYRPLPVMLAAALLPFKGVVITDGLMATMNIFIGSGMKKQFKDIYTTAKRRNQIKTLL